VTGVVAGAGVARALVAGRSPAPLVGTRMRRREDERLLTGAGRFLDNLDFEGCYEAAILRSPHAAARIVGIDATAARAARGVAGVYTAADLAPIMHELPPKVTHPQLNQQPRYPIAARAVRYVGEAVAVVVAQSRYLAEDALELIDIDYAPRPAVASTAAALASGAALVHEASASNVAVHLVQRAGDPDTALATAPHVLTETFVITRGGGHSLEGRAVAARFEPATGQLTVWDATQTPHYVRQMLSVLYGMAEDEIRVIAPADIGGGFGPKAQFYGEEALIPWIAMQLRAPVKWVEDRWENFVSATMERSQTHRVQAGFGGDGRLLVVKDVFEHDQGAYCVGLQVPTITMSTLPGPYKIPNIHSELIACYTNMPPTSSLRGAGRPQAVVAMERIMDRVAEHLGLEPDEVRRRNLIQPDEFPYPVGLQFRDGSPLTYDSGNYPALLDEAVRRIGLAGFRARQARARREGTFLGLGLAMFVEGSGLGPYEGARVRLTNGGRILVTLAASPQGQGYETVYAQLAADALGVDVNCVEVRHGDTASIPFGQGTFASRITATAGPAVFDACRQLHADLIAAGASLLGAEPGDVEVAGDGVRVLTGGDGGPARTLREIAAVSNVGRHGMTLGRGMPAAIERTAYFKPQRAVYSSGIAAVIVAVDPETGQVTVVRSVLGHDCGTVLNPLLVEGQLLGGWAHGLGNALYEEAVYDADGQPLATSYLDYAVPTAIEVLRPELFHVCSPSPLNPLGVKGAGEGGLIPVPAAIANAVEDALRPFAARITVLPVTPSRVLTALRGPR
jgi:aerobic carbon-monoxide dehydrogenase large subunit